jgi:hypothetical protein
MHVASLLRRLQLLLKDRSGNLDAKSCDPQMFVWYARHHLVPKKAHSSR